MKASTKAAIARVEAGPLASRSIGTAFLISERYLLTALHVVGDRKSLHSSGSSFFEPIKLFFGGSNESVNAHVVEGCWNTNADWALLEIAEAPLDARPILLATLTDGVTPKFNSFGYPIEHGSLSVKGEVRDVAANYYDAQVLQLFCEELGAGGSPLNGLSGSPCLVGDFAVGVVRAHPVKKEVIGAAQSITVKNGVLYACPLPEIISLCNQRISSLTILAPRELSPEALRLIVHGEERPARCPTPQDFETYLADKRKGFVGRKRLFERVNAWTKKGPGHALLVIGDPGFGKSAIVAEMIERRQAMEIVAWFCCRWDYQDQLSPRVFVEAIAASLAENLPSYAEILATSELQTLLEKAQTGTQVGPRTLFEQLVLGPLGRLPKPPASPQLIVVDALDESLAVPQGIVDLLAGTLHQWPKWLRIVATSRDHPEVLESLHGMQAEILKANNADNKDDLSDYVIGRLQLPTTGGERVTDNSRYRFVMEVAQGNFLIGKLLIDEIDAGYLDQEELDNIKLRRDTSLVPLGLQLFYQRSFDRLFPEEQDFLSARMVLALTMAALEPLDLPTLQVASGVENAKLGAILRKLASFLPLRSDKHFAFFHKSVHDWLDVRMVDAKYGDPIAKRFAIDIQVGQQLLVHWAQHIFEADYSKTPRYVLRHLPAHLIELGDTNRLRAVLFDFNWLSIKLDQLGIQAILEDFERLPLSLAKQQSLQLLQRSLQMTAHILARSPKQLASQLLGRVRQEMGPEFVSLLNAARRWRGGVWLLPIRVDMQPPGALLRIMEGHEGGVAALAFSSNSKRIVSGSDDGTLRLWDAANGQCIGSSTYQEWYTSVVRVAFSLDGTRILSESAYGTPLLWDAASCQPIGYRMKRHELFVKTAAFSPDGTRIVSRELGETLRLWDATNGEPIGGPLEGHEMEVLSVAFSPDGKRLVSGCHDGTMCLWNTTTGQPIGVLVEGHKDAVYSIAFSPDGKRIVSGSRDRTLRLWDASSCQPIGSLMEGHGDSVTNVAYSPDGKRIVSGSLDGTMYLWDATTGQPISALPWDATTGPPISAFLGRTRSWFGFSPDSTRIVSQNDDGTLRWWDAASGQCIVTTYLEWHEVKATCIDFSPDGKRIVSGSNDGTLRLWDATSGQPISRPMEGHRDVVRAVAFSPEGKHVLSGSDDGTLRLWDTASNSCISNLLEGHRDWVRSVAFSPDGKRIVSGSDDGTLRLWDATNGEPIGGPLEGHEMEVWSVAFSPDAKRIVSGSCNPALWLWDATTGQPIGTPLEGHDGTVTSVAFSRDGKRIISGSYDGTVWRWDAATGQPINTPLEGYEGNSVPSVAFSPDGTRIVLGSDHGIVQLWDISGQWIDNSTCQEWHEGRVKSVAFSPDGMCVVSGSEDGTLRLWDATSGQPIGTPLEGHKDWVLSVAFSSDGAHIVSGSNDRTIRLWEVKSGHELTQIELESIVTSVAWHGEMVAAGGANGAVYIFRVVGPDDSLEL
ncbi:PQQ-binding-like beta-propeller repeat protein [Nitrosospira briensis]|uniref:PQQ-binding-like beta-propeller repeat protein n=1 Tax=Nitrosospira briensis TaxID=35799 RepID=UPI0008DFDF56|nr:PQQ-binding-like beta-propeller repeat protein [Nitrosospira briensis]SFO43524.1 WD40 repeat [Nitrosospira briensis]